MSCRRRWRQSAGSPGAGSCGYVRPLLLLQPPGSGPAGSGPTTPTDEVIVAVYAGVSGIDRDCPLTMEGPPSVLPAPSLTFARREVHVQSIQSNRFDCDRMWSQQCRGKP